MITLTNPPDVASVLGGTTRVPYQKLVLDAIRCLPKQRLIDGTVAMTASTAPEMPAIAGSFQADIVGLTLTITVPQLGFYRRINLNSGQQSALQNILDQDQNQLESGLISVGVVAGVQTSGV